MSVLARGEQPSGTYDICVVGAGPVGLALAMEAADAGARVLLIDAGALDSARRPAPPVAGQRTEIADAARHAPIALTTRQGIGGTSWLWGGRCVAFEPIDLEPRAHVPGIEWPIRLADVSPWYAATARHLDCGEPEFRSPHPDWAGLQEVTMSNLERWARQPRLAPGLGARVCAHPGVTVVLDSRLIDVELDDDPVADRLGGGDDSVVVVAVVIREGRPLRVRATSFVLAMGGLEITRFLLGMQRRHRGAFGGPAGALGRYYMGHATGTIADLVLEEPARAADLDFVRDASDTYTRRRFTFSEAAQRRHRLLNTSFYLDNPAFYEHEHRNATLSAVFLGIAIPPIGRAILAEGIRLRHVGPRPYRIGAHVRNVLRTPWRAAADVWDILRRRYLSRVRKPGFILHNDGGRYALHYHGEQLPHPDSRITMRTDETGAEVLRVDLRYDEADIDSLLRCHELLDRELRAAGIGRLEYHETDAVALRALAWEQATDGFHSIGTTRMSADPARGVVDGDCRVHGVQNLYIASSSVLPTSAEANPTFFAAALAVRLAHHLAASRAQTPAVGIAEGIDA